MTGPDALAAALLARDVAGLRALAGQLSGELSAVAQAGLRRLGAPVQELPDAALALLRLVAGHPGLSLAELAELAGRELGADAALLRDRGLVTSQRFERTDCWTRTAEGAAVLRAAATTAVGESGPADPGAP